MWQSWEKMARFLSGTIVHDHTACWLCNVLEVFKLVLKMSSWHRNVRREAMKQVDKHEKDGDISEDEKKSLADSIQELTDDYVKQIDKLAKAKQDELVKI